MERLGKWFNLRRRRIAGLMAVILVISSIGIPVPVMGSEVWPQQSTAPYYCLDGGKGWKATDRYEIYQYDTLPAPLTETQAKRLFWAYPSNWNALKDAAAKYDTELYGAIASEVSSPNIVKRVKDQSGTKFAWVADHPEIEARAISALEKAAAENAAVGNKVPELMEGSISEDTAVLFTIPALTGPGIEDTELNVGSAFVGDIVSIEPQSVWDNGSTGGKEGWLDASQDGNIAKGILGDDLYEITWSEDTIRIHNNGSAFANEHALNKEMSDDVKYNKTKVRYKITMRPDSGWYTSGAWDKDYLRNWMDFKACTNAPEHQRLYKADIRIVPSDLVFYMVIAQEPIGGFLRIPDRVEGETSELSFRVYRHEETFKSHYNVKMKKVDSETGKPLKGSQFYLYERFEDEDKLSENEKNGALADKNFNISPWSGFQIFAEGVTDENGEIHHTDTRTYRYSKTYCDGHGSPQWAEESRDQNRKAAKEWLDLFERCEEEEKSSGGTHFHWQVDEALYDSIVSVAESGESEEMSYISGMDAEESFEASGCKSDCEQTYKEFINLKFTYTWKEVQARNGYILHGLHQEDQPIHFVTTVSSEAGAGAEVSEGVSSDIAENIWYNGNKQGEVYTLAEQEQKQREFAGKETSNFHFELSTDSDSFASNSNGIKEASDANAVDLNENRTASASNAEDRTVLEKLLNLKLFSYFRTKTKESRSDDSSWEESEGTGMFSSYLDSAEDDGIKHLKTGDGEQLSYAGQDGETQKYWIVQDHRTEGEIHINKRDLDLFKGESEVYSSFGDTEGDGTLEGAVYGLFAAEDIVHPDSDIMADGTVSNTGIVYKHNDLVSVAETDGDGNASFFTYTVAPGRTFDYESGNIIKRTDFPWEGPENLYINNQQEYGNWWIGRPLILGNYYVKELSRSEGYELSINGKAAQWTNFGASVDTPQSIAMSAGTAVLSMPELSATMENEDQTGSGYDQLTFSVTSSGTKNKELQTEGYEFVISGFPKGTEFYRVDTGEMEVTGPHVTGTEQVVVKDEDGNVVWKTAAHNKSNVKYQPQYDERGAIIGQKPISRMEYQIQTLRQIANTKGMRLEKIEIDLSQNLWSEKIVDHHVEDISSELFGFIKANLEYVLNQNGYDVPTTAEGKMSQKESPVFSMGVVKDEIDTYGMTTAAGLPAVKTVYGAAIREITVKGVNSETTALEILQAILSWYQEETQWSFGGLHHMQIEGDTCRIAVYVGRSAAESKNFFTVKEKNGQMEPDSVYLVLENSKDLRWEYQEYKESGEYQYQASKKYYFGSGNGKRYYMDVTVTPAVMVDEMGEIRKLEHQVMEYHKAGEEIIDYLAGDSAYGYRVPLTETADKIEITTEMEYADQDILLSDIQYEEQTGLYTVFVPTAGTDAFGKSFSDETQSLTLTFMVKFPEKLKTVTSEDIQQLNHANVYGYREGDVIGFAEYLMRFTDAAVGIQTGKNMTLMDTYIVSKRLCYRGQHRVIEDGSTLTAPIQVLERPIKQKVEVEKGVRGEDAIDNFRFKIYLKSNLERLYCENDGSITWLDRTGKEIDIENYKSTFPELVQKLYTRETGRTVLEKMKAIEADSDGTEKQADVYNYEKFFDAVRTANIDRWNQSGDFWNTSWKPFVKGLFSNIWNEVNSSEAAKENSKRTDAVRQFAIDWYLEEEVKQQRASEDFLLYQDEGYDKALYEAILKAEIYLKPFFLYDLDSIYEILWDSEPEGGIDCDKSTLAADQIDEDQELARGVSEYLPYGDYVIVEQQPYNSKWNDFPNKHFEIDTPKELSLPQSYDSKGVIIEPSEIPWSMTDPKLTDSTMVGNAIQSRMNERYYAKLRIEKLDAETGESILHDDAVFALYRAERNEDENGDGSVKRYREDTMISGSKLFLEAMGAQNISTFARLGSSEKMGVGTLYTGIVSAGTPICSEEHQVLFSANDGLQQGSFLGLSTTKNLPEQETVQITGYAETPEPLEAGVYVLAELRPPAGYVRSKPIPVEVYSDKITYYSNGKTDKTTAVTFENEIGKEERVEKTGQETARIYVHDIATSLEVSKLKTADSYRGMKVSGRVEGSVSELKNKYGLENLDLAYNSSGTYLGFGWKKGTLEYLENRKALGERVQLVYEDGVFQGYGYVTRQLNTADEENRYISGAQMALFEAIELKRSGDSEDFAYEGLTVERDRNGNVSAIFVEEGFAGETTEFEKNENGVWNVKTAKREDTPVLFYDLGNLKVTETNENGELFGYNRNGQKIKITFDTKSVYAIQDGRAAFEISGSNFETLSYNSREKVFSGLSEDMVIYHLDADFCRDALVDGYTGLAYVEKSRIGKRGEEETFIYVWPVTELKDKEGRIYAREKILTGRPGEQQTGTSMAYITGTLNGETNEFEKKMNPYLNEYGLVEHYPSSDITYKKGESIYDRDGEYLGYRYDDLLDEYNRASYNLLEEWRLYDEESLFHRKGEAWIVPNIWISGEETPKNLENMNLTNGQADILRRIVPGTYIMEELNAPEGYVRSLPTAVLVEESGEVQREVMVDEKIKVEISKVDGTTEYQKSIRSEEFNQSSLSSVEARSSYTGTFVENAELALYKARREFSSDRETHPNGYYLVKEESTPARWYVESGEDNQPVMVEAVWVTGKYPQYFEGIPSGYYILEERKTPEGYLPASMELYIRETDELQSFILTDDHTKLEVFKYEKIENGMKVPLEWPAEAELTLYPAILNSSGNAVKQDGKYIYDEKDKIVSWTTGNIDEYERIAEEYERMFGLYKDEFEHFSWTVDCGGTSDQRSAKLENSNSTGNGEVITQIWRLENGEKLRITTSLYGEFEKTDINGVPRPSFEYQFQYEKGENASGSEYVSYNFLNGLHRLDRIPEGSYILVESKTPEGYCSTQPKLVVVEKTGDIQRVYLENAEAMQPEKKGTLVIEKYDAENHSHKLAGAWFEITNLQNKDVYRVVTGEDGKAVIKNLPVTGTYEGGVEGPCYYEVTEIFAPEGYQMESFVQRFCFNADDAIENIVYQLPVENKKTELIISKKDFHTGLLVEGAQLSIYKTKLDDGVFVMDGDPLDTWISKDIPHKVVGKLSCGKTYLLVEETAPDGYQKESPIRFTVSSDGKRITEITDHMARVRIDYQDGTDLVDRMLITGRIASTADYRLWNYGEELARVQGVGDKICWPDIKLEEETVREKYTGEILISEGKLLFSDGSEVSVNREIFRLENGSRRKYESSGRYPVSTEYQIVDEEGVRIDKWTVSVSAMSHEIPNLLNSEGVLRFESGKEYKLIETVVFNDGESLITDQMIIDIGAPETSAGLLVLNRETDFRFRKTDLTTGEELPGAVLQVSDRNGAVLDEWISGEDEHVMKGIFVPGETYILSETMAADGYAYSEDIPFTVHENGLAERVVMEDRPTHVEIRKTDAVTGKELPGAKLTLKDKDGKIVDQWVSGENAHVIRGKLIAGDSYTLIEEIAPDGYLLSESIVFTVSKDGSIDRVKMEDKRQTETEEPEKPEEPKEPEKPEEPEESESPKDPSPEENNYGFIKAAYEPKMKQKGAVRLLYPANMEQLKIPKTGEPAKGIIFSAGILLSLMGLYWSCRRKEKMENGKTKLEWRGNCE